MSILVQAYVRQRKFSTTAAKAIAVQYADYADDEGRGIWPSDEAVACETDCSIPTVRRWRKKFVDMRLLILVKKGGGGPKSPNQYDLNLDVLLRIPLHEVAQKRQERASGLANKKVITVTTLDENDDKKGDHCDSKGDHGDQKGDHGDHQTVSNHKDNRHSHANARDGDAGASEREVKNDFKKKEKLFHKHGPSWPSYPVDSHKEALRVMDKLSLDDCQDACERICEFVDLSRKNNRSKFVAIAKYFKDELWKQLPTRVAQAPVKSTLAVWGTHWMAQRLWLLKTYKPMQRGDRTMAIVNDRGRVSLSKVSTDLQWAYPYVAMLDAGDGLVPADDPVPAVKHYTKVNTASEEFEAWQKWFEQNGWPLLPTPNGGDVWVWVPVANPIDMSLDDLIKQKSNEVAA